MSEVRLIDANALKEDLRQYFTKGEALYQILTIIDNAPTVEGYKNVIVGGMNNPYNAGYMDGIRQAYKELERPHGEWENDSDNLPICNKCGEIALQRIFVKMPHLIQDVRMVRSNYCPNCGADMRKGGAE